MKRVKVISYTCLMVVLCAAVAIASEHGAEGGEAVHGNDWGNFAFRLVNFAAFVGIIWWAAGKKIVGFFSSRRYNIETELNELSKRKMEAEKHLAEVERNIANVQSERERIIADYKSQGEALKESIVEKAHKQAEVIRRQAEITAEQEAKYAMEKMRAEIAELIAQAAEKALAKKLTKEEHEKLIDKYLTKVVFN